MKLKPRRMSAITQDLARRSGGIILGPKGFKARAPRTPVVVIPLDNPDDLFERAVTAYYAASKANKNGMEAALKEIGVL